jgi:hypothetical protein
MQGVDVAGSRAEAWSGAGGGVAHGACLSQGGDLLGPKVKPAMSQKQSHR